MSYHLHAVVLPAGSDPVDLWVAEGRVTDVPQPGAETLPGGWVLAGLVDAHAHLSIDTAGTGRAAGSPELVDANLRAHRDAGVLAVRDVGAVPGARLPDGEAAVPRIVRAGRFLAPPDGYIPGLYEPVAAGELVVAASDELAGGTTWVKVIADFPPDYPNGPAEANYDVETLSRLVEVVHAAGARVAAHVTGRALRDVVAAGIDSIEHGVRMDEASLTELGRRGGAWTPTLTTTRQMLGEQRFPRFVERIGPLLRGASAAGVTVLAGTDVHPPGSLPAEVALLRECGLSPVDALSAASSAGRRYLGLPPLLEPGAPADLVCYPADPRDDPEVLSTPSAIVGGGRRVRP